MLSRFLVLHPLGGSALRENIFSQFVSVCKLAFGFLLSVLPHNVLPLIIAYDSSGATQLLHD